MIEKYLYSDTDARVLCDFLEPMLAVDMRERTHARDMKDNKWLELTHEESLAVDW